MILPPNVAPLFSCRSGTVPQTRCAASTSPRSTTAASRWTTCGTTPASPTPAASPVTCRDPGASQSRPRPTATARGPSPTKGRQCGPHHRSIREQVGRAGRRWAVVGSGSRVMALSSATPGRSGGLRAKCLARPRGVERIRQEVRHAVTGSRLSRTPTTPHDPTGRGAAPCSSHGPRSRLSL